MPSTASTQFPQLDQDIKPEAVHIDNIDYDGDIKKESIPSPVVQMKSSLDDLSTWQAIKRYKRICAICMMAAFAASLEGYQINLNGSIVSNKGFIEMMAGKNAKILDGKYVSAWGGIQSAGQFVGQILLPFITNRFGRKPAMYAIWIVLVVSIAIETVTSTYWHWLIAKLFAGIGVGCIQATLPVYIGEHSPNQLRGFLINAYTFWFVVGQMIAPVVLREMAAHSPMDYKTPILTQWGMIGVLLLIFVYLPESPWWLVTKGKVAQAESILFKNNGHIQGYDVKQQIGIMEATLEAERLAAEASASIGRFELFKGRNGIRMLISLWPKLMQQFVGLTLFNTYSTYFFQVAGNKNPFQVTIILACVQLISVLLTAAFSDGFGRRPLVLTGYALTVVSVLCLGIVGCFDYEKPALGALLIFFACLAIFSTTGASAIGYAYVAEVPTQRLRAISASYGLAITNLVAIMFSFVAPIMIKGSGDFKGWKAKTGFFYAGTGIPTVVLAYFIVPEVARRSPAEIDELFESGISLRKFKGHKTEVELNHEARNVEHDA